MKGETLPPTPKSFPNMFRGGEYPLHFIFDPEYHNMSEEEMEGHMIGTAKTCGPKQYLYWEQGMVIAKGKQNGNT